DRFKLNGTVYSLEEIKNKYQEQVDKEEEDFEIKCEIESWQVKGITPHQIYVEIDFGIDRKGTISIPAQKLDQLDNGNFIAYLKNSDFFYFLNEKNAKDNKFVYGATVIKQLSQKNGELVLRKNPRIANLNQLVDELNFLSLNGVTNAQQFENLQTRFIDQLKATDQELDKLDEKVAKINKLAGALENYQTSIVPSETAAKILDEARIDKTMDLNQLKKEIKELQIERNALKKVRDKIVSDYTFREKLDQKYNQRKSKSL
ncbi:helical hairpin domain-containing protein, partial [Streptococcus sobrinus]